MRGAIRGTRFDQIWTQPDSEVSQPDMEWGRPEEG